DDVDDGAGPGPRARLLDQLLEDPGVVGAPGVLEVDGGDGVGHARKFTRLRRPPPDTVLLPPPRAGEGRGGGPPIAPTLASPHSAATLAECTCPRPTTRTTPTPSVRPTGAGSATRSRPRSPSCCCC